MENYSEKTVINEGVDAYGTKKEVIFHGTEMIVKRSYDAQSIMDECKEQRILTAGDRWGDMKKVGTIPMADYEKFMLIKDQVERRKAVKLFLQQNPNYITFEKYKQ
jgi:hypothetical protein